MDRLNEILAHGVGFWEVVGFLGLVVFTSRFVVQWIVSERRRESVIPISFWYLSIVGSLLLLSYAFERRDPIFVLSYLFNGVIYLRNLYLIHRRRRAEAD